MRKKIKAGILLFIYLKHTYSLLVIWLAINMHCFGAEGKNPDPNFMNMAEQLMLQQRSLHFLENKGQIADQNGKTVPDVLFSVSMGSLNLFITKTGYSYVLLKEISVDVESDTESSVKSKENEAEEESKRPKSFEYNRIDVLLKGARIDKDNIIVGSGSVEHFNFFYPHCPQGIYDVKEYDRLTIKNIYPNIDWVWYSAEKGLKYDFIVHPGASPEQITLVYNYADLSVNREGDFLTLKTPLGKLSEGGLICYSGEKKITSSFQQYKNEISISVNNYDRSTDLIIDPPLVLLWSTNYGGASGLSTSFRSSDVDSQGNLVAVAWAAGTLVFPTQSWGGAYFQGVVNGNQDITISKFTNAGARLWATFYGGSGSVSAGDDDVFDIDCDGADNIFVVGYTGSTDFPVQSAFQPANNGFTDIYLVKFNSTGVIQWATYFGGSGYDYGGGVTTDASGNVYIIGVSQTWGVSNIPFKDPGSGAYYQNTSGATNSNDVQQLIAQFNPAGNLLWCTLFGNETNGSADIKIDNFGNIVISGASNRNASSQSQQWIPVTNPGGGAYFQPLSGGSTDLYFARFTPSRGLYWCTYFGGIQDEYTWIDSRFPFANFLYIDKCNNLFCIANARDNTVLKDPGNGAYFSSVATLMPSFSAKQPLLIKFNNQCSLTWSTYLATYANSCNNGSAYSILGIALTGDPFGNLFVTGNIEHNQNIPLVDPGGGAFYQSTHPSTNRICGNFGKDDGWIMGFCPNGAMKWATYITTSNLDEMDDFQSINCDSNGNIFCVGERMGTTAFPFVNPSGGAYFQNTTNGAVAGDWQGTITKFQAANFTCPALTTTATANPSQCGCNGTATVTASNGNPAYTYRWLPGNQSTQTVIGLCPGTYSVITNDAGCERDTSIIVVTGIGTSMPLTTSVTNATCTSNNGTASVSALGGSGTYTYTWSNGQSSQTLTGLSKGTYTVTVKDGNGCTSITSVYISKPQISISTTTNATTCNSANGSATAWTGGAPGPYTYSWSNGITGNNAGTCPSTTFQGIAYCVSSGTYTVTVTNANGCSSTTTATVTSSPGNNTSFTQSPSGTVCIGTMVNFTNTGTPPGTGITYNWVISPITPANVSGTTTDFSYSFLSAGTYTIQHTVAGNGCNTTANSTVNVINCSAGPTVTATGSSVCIGTCAIVTSSGMGGTSPYTYSWSNGATTQNINPCPTSTTSFTVTITDNGGNTSTSAATVTVNAAITATTSVTNITCNGGTGSVAAAGGSGSSPYGYSWNSGQTTQTIAGLSAGSYTVTVTDSKGCTATSTATIISPAPLVGQFTKGTASCAGCGCKEWIMINAMGGTSPYTYLWTDGYTNRYKNKFCPGTYTINIKDKNGCVVNMSVSVP